MASLRRAHGSIALLALLAPGCASPPTPPAVLAEDGTSLWQRVETGHFVVESNLRDERRLLRVASDFETLWHAFASVPILGLRPPAAKPLVVVLRDPAEYRYLAGGQSAGLFIHRTQLGPLILLPPNSGPFRETVVKHELAHFVSSDFMPDAPQWLAEGLAQVMQTAEYDTGKGEILLGAHSPGLVHGASARLSSVQLMRAWPAEQRARERHGYYGRSWLLVHYLIDHHLQAFLDFVVRVAAGEDWQSAWVHEIPLASGEIDDALDAYFRRERYGLWTVAAHLPDMDGFEVTAVPRSDAYALRAVLRACLSNPARERSRDVEAADRDLRTAFEIDPEGERARRVRDAKRQSTR